MATLIVSDTSVLARLAALASDAGKALRCARPARHCAVVPSRMLQHAGDTEACGTFTPEDGGPTAIVVGARAPMDSLRRLAAKHRLETEALIRFARSC